MRIPQHGERVCRGSCQKPRIRREADHGDGALVAATECQLSCATIIRNLPDLATPILATRCQQGARRTEPQGRDRIPVADELPNHGRRPDVPQTCCPVEGACRYGSGVGGQRHRHDCTTRREDALFDHPRVNAPNVDIAVVVADSHNRAVNLDVDAIGVAVVDRHPLLLTRVEVDRSAAAVTVNSKEGHFREAVDVQNGVVLHFVFSERAAESKPLSIGQQEELSALGVPTL
mmetsp:Transcript_100808/g.289729  ORF Transcript_100808/g.289729 Transcript_100808/m.289729 type:complete len:232 (+) Transcript_100808:470-1165(+)